MKGGTEDVFSGGAADVSQVYGSAVVSSGSSVYADTVHSGGALTVSSAGSVGHFQWICGDFRRRRERAGNPLRRDG